MQVNAGSGFFLTGLALLFITLKLTGYIAWSWWWVLAPIWVPFAVVLFILSMVGLVAGALWLFSGRR